MTSILKAAEDAAITSAPRLLTADWIHILEMEKSELWPTMVYEGVLPVKAFSMGEANEKRYYMEARIIKR